MGIYDKAGERVQSGLFIKTESGQKLRIRILDMPYVSSRVFRPGQPVKTQFAWPVWDYKAKQVRILQKGNSVFSQVGAIVEEYGEDTPMACDIVLSTKGSGIDTEYTLVPGRVQSELPKDWQKMMPDMDDKIKGGIPLKDFSDGKDPVPQSGDNNAVDETVPDFSDEDAAQAGVR